MALQFFKNAGGFSIKIRGIIPDPVNAPRINTGISCGDENVVTVYTAPPFKVGFISSASLDSKCGATIGSTGMRVKNASGVTQYFIHYLNFGAPNGQAHTTGQFIPALEIYEGWYVEIYGTKAGHYVRGHIFGWEEDVNI